MVAIYIAPNYISTRYWGTFPKYQVLNTTTAMSSLWSLLLCMKIINIEKSYLGIYIYAMFCGIEIVYLDGSCKWRNLA